MAMDKGAWASYEPGPECLCGRDTFILVQDGWPALVCLRHHPHWGAIFPMPTTKPAHWPNLALDELQAVIRQARTHEATP